MTVRIRLIKSYMQPDGAIIPRGKLIEVEGDVAAFLEGCKPPRAIRAEKSEEIEAYDARIAENKKRLLAEVETRRKK